IRTAHARGRVSGASPASGTRRSAGLSAHDTITNIKNTSGASHTSTTSPASRCDATAPDHWKKAPAYAHSFSRGNPGAMIAAAAPTCHTTEMYAKYCGYPRWGSWTPIHSICSSFHTDPATNSKTTTKVQVREGMDRI